MMKTHHQDAYGINNFIACPVPQSLYRCITPEQRAEGMNRMIDDAMCLLHIDFRDNAYWTGSKTDLMELVTMLQLSGRIVGADGRPASLKFLATQIFARLHLALPYNIYQLASASTRRKGRMCSPLWLRYCRDMYLLGNRWPLKDCVLKLSC